MVRGRMLGLTALALLVLVGATACNTVSDEPERGTGAGTITLDGISLTWAVRADSLDLTFLPDHENLLLYAEDVALFHQRRGYGHRTENVSAVTMANEQVSYFQQ